MNAIISTLKSISDIILNVGTTELHNFAIMKSIKNKETRDKIHNEIHHELHNEIHNEIHNERHNREWQTQL